jgi:hypothetical protein
MSIPASCTHCGRRHRAPDSLAGLQFKCKGCGKPVAVPNSGPVPRTPSRRSSPQPARSSSTKPIVDDTEDEYDTLTPVPVLPRRSMREIAEKKSDSAIAPIPSFGLGTTLEERIAQRAAETATKDASAAPVKMLAAGIVLLIVGAALLGIDLGSRFYDRRFGLSILGIGLYYPFFGAGLAVLIVTIVQWIASRSRE